MHAENKAFAKRPVTPVSLKRRTPVPSDIEIAQESDLRPIVEITEEMGLLPSEIECMVLSKRR